MMTRRQGITRRSATFDTAATGWLQGLRRPFRQEGHVAACRPHDLMYRVLSAHDESHLLAHLIDVVTRGQLTRGQRQHGRHLSRVDPLVHE